MDMSHSERARAQQICDGVKGHYELHRSHVPVLFLGFACAKCSRAIRALGLRTPIQHEARFIARLQVLVPAVRGLVLL
jgi:hypothetical protein